MTFVVKADCRDVHNQNSELIPQNSHLPSLNTMVFLLRDLFGFGDFTLEKPAPGRCGRRPPTVLTREEVRLVFSHLENPWKLVAQIQYGSGLRLMQALRLRVKDIDFGQGTITVSSKGESTSAPSRISSATRTFPPP